MISLPDWCAKHSFKEFLELMLEDLSGFQDGLNAKIVPPNETNQKYEKNQLQIMSACVNIENIEQAIQEAKEEYERVQKELKAKGINI